MATIDDVIQWANSLPAWQGDAVRRILIRGETPLNDQDFTEVLALAKAELNLDVPPEKIKPIPPAAGNFSGAPAIALAVKLVAINDVQNVNIIQSGQTLPFAENGVTVVYGDNGSGKSGYSRILKLACHARDKDERILPDVFAAKVPIGIPKATLKIKQDDKEKEITWSQGVPADPILANITVFDGRCARVITDDRNEISYLPYGGDVFQKTAEIVLRVKSALEAEIVKLVPVQDSAVGTGTTAETFLKSLSETTKDVDIQAATRWNPQDDTELAALEELVRVSDSTKATQEIARLEKMRARLNETAGVVARLCGMFDALSNDAFIKVLSEVKMAQGAHAAAMVERQSYEPLPGVGVSSQWEILYNAAKQYSEQIAYPGEEFPKTVDGLCVLCQQPLQPDAVVRFTRFKKHIENVTNTVLAAKSKALVALRERVELVTPLSGGLLEAVCDDLTVINGKTADTVRAYHETVGKRKAASLALLRERTDPEIVASLPPWPVTVESDIRAIVQTLNQQIVDITNAARPEEYKKLVANVTERKSRKALNARKNDIVAFVANASRNAKLRDAVATLRTKEITRQGTIIIRKNLTPELISAFKRELALLGATRVPISLKPIGDAGETAHEILLEGANTPGKVHTSQILSEGETRVVAVAGFLAELQLAPHKNGIVLDDPVSSLDHVFTGKIAARLTQEGLTRQVIIFTHNIAFLMELEDAATTLALSGTPVGITVHSLRRIGKTAGVTMNGAPWHTMTVKSRVHYLEELVHKYKALHTEDVAKYNEYAARIYCLLREAWEACIEEDLFYSVVCRYRNSVQTLKLDQVHIDDQDVHTVDLHMSKASNWMTGHDKSKALHVDRPEPKEVLSDINTLRLFSKGLVDRRKETKDRRAKQLKPAVSNN